MIYGGQGNDTIYALGSLDAVYGDGGRDTVVFQGRRSQYTVTPVTSDGSEVVVKRRDAAPNTQVATLYDVEFLRFNNGIFSTGYKRRTRGPHR